MQRDNSFEHNQDGRVVRCKAVERNQLLLRPVDVERLVGEEHAVRAIWELVQKLALEPFYTEIGALQGEAGRPAWDPKVLISLWIYAIRVGSVRRARLRGCVSITRPISG